MLGSSKPIVLLCQIAAIVTVSLMACLAIDTVTGWFGYSPYLFCKGVIYAAAGANRIAVIVVMLGIFAWAVSRFRSDAAMGIVIGGSLFAIFPQVLPHYLGVSCILP
ncbi:hypothetical protein DC415_23905 [Agrobacterium tumefaciens]|uniref:Uncharacterized protein n=1 Tax=Rhizobium rhizogenes TaxID=359 RepID=A0AA92BYX5_RHIRH|nr:hypothetical protein DC430_23555 [Rhizobium rhizogenes]PVE61996.1 hypothetical protein DC415_23905 [Agrobacterium tumefaciens]PVE69760.1 hypothetical protein DCP16_23905 [Sphingomonas sp. TPD3009]